MIDARWIGLVFASLLAGCCSAQPRDPEPPTDPVAPAPTPEPSQPVQAPANRAAATTYGEAWEVVARPGQFGRRRDELVAGWNAEYGEDGWKVAYEVEGRIFARDAVLMLYEDAYYEYLKATPDVLDWLCETGSDVYDNAPSNTGSGFDYGIQETSSNHVQDISLRRALLRLGRWFQGDHPIEVRGSKSEGGHLSPGKLPFHRPEWIRQPRQTGWWRKDSIEDFYQSNKVVIARKR